MNAKKRLLDTQQFEITKIDHQIEAALTLIKNHQREGQRLPWVLLMGAHGVGKTSLLTHSELKLTSPSKKSLNNLTSTKGIDWWISNEAVYIDVGAKYTTATDNELQNKAYWHHFLQKIAEKRDYPFDSICFVIDVSSLIHPFDPHYENLINRFVDQIQTLAQINSPSCINLIISQCDTINGFAEFFNHLDKQAQNQVLGFTISDPENQTHIVTQFKENFQSFIKMINQCLLPRLHHEPNLERRQRIMEFPLQLECLIDPLKQIVENLAETSNIFLKNLFFCSAKQTTHTINLLSHQLNKAFSIKPTIEKPLVAAERAFFIPNMLKRIAQPTRVLDNVTQTKKTKWWQFSVYPASIILILIGTFAFHHGYHQNLKALAIINKAPSIKAKIFPELNQLALLHQQLDNQPTPSFPGFKASRELKTKLKSVYQTELKNTFVNYLQKTLTTTIKLQIKQNSSDLYNALQVYLMLAQPQQLKSDFVLSWFKNHWGNQFVHHKLEQTQLMMYLGDLLQNSQIPWKSDQQLIQSAQKVLQQQPLAQIAFKMLRSNNSLDSEAISSTQSIQGVDLSQATIPYFYSPVNFSYIYNQQIPELAKSIAQRNWVTGKTNPSKDDLDKLTHELKIVYLKHYLSEWQETLKNITFTKPKSINDAINQINLITNPESPLWQIYTNAITTAKIGGAEDEVDTLTHNIIDYAPNNDKSDALIKPLDTLQECLLEINNAPSSIKASYDAAVSRFKNGGEDKDDAITNVLKVAKQLPQPLQQWVTTVAQNSWGFMVNDASIYLNTLWKTNVTPFYNQRINNNYPIFSASKNDISIDNFNKFFGPGGIIQVYFTNNLMPFVNISHAYWTWKTLDGQAINIPQSNLDMLIRASMIQKMFYSDNPQQPTIRAKLTPVDMSTQTNQFILNIGGQMVRYLPGLRKTSEITWPGADGNFVTMRFNDASKNPTFTTSGPWAWLRMLDQAVIQSTNDPQNFQVTFKLGQDQAVYNMVADNRVNPYLPDVLNGFRCPESLLSNS